MKSGEKQTNKTRKKGRVREEVLFLACVAGAWKYWTQEKTGAQKGNSRVERELLHPSRVSLARAHSLFHPLLPSARYAGYAVFSCSLLFAPSPLPDDRLEKATVA